jgi:hypothetical protein
MSGPAFDVGLACCAPVLSVAGFLLHLFRKTVRAKQLDRYAITVALLVPLCRYVVVRACLFFGFILPGSIELRHESGALMFTMLLSVSFVAGSAWLISSSKWLSGPLR